MTRPTNAQGQPYLRESWQDNTAYCARTHKFGQVRSLASEARAIGEPSFRTGLAFMLGFAALVYTIAELMP